MRFWHLFTGQGKRISLNSAAEASNIETIVSDAQNVRKCENAGHTRSTLARESRSSKNDSNSDISNIEITNNQSRHDAAKIKMDNSFGGRRGLEDSDISAGKDDIGSRRNSSCDKNSSDNMGGKSGDIRDHRRQNNKVDKAGVDQNVPPTILQSNSQPKTEMDIARDCKESDSICEGQTQSLFDEEPVALTVVAAPAAFAPVRHEMPLHKTHTCKPSRQSGIFDDEDGPTIIFDEDSMQSVDYERNMLNQDFNGDTVDILERVDEDDEDVL